jgi:hypothetical protein
MANLVSYDKDMNIGFVILPMKLKNFFLLTK